ncbi:MAG TPA: hypothetical protein VGW10_07690 [Solirubrobacteraceae bacterium]|nr:hypothetical protein [Solirubrobacteraceae bacterium]
MPRLPPLLLALVLGLLAAFAVACGDEGDDRKLLAPSRAEAIRTELDTIAERVERGECTKLDPAFQRLNEAIDRLPATTDRELRARLREGADNLEEIAPGECREQRPETTETTETQPETTTTPPETETAPPPTTEEPPPTTEVPPPTTEEPPVDPGDSGGSQAPESFVPPGQSKKGEKE